MISNTFQDQTKKAMVSFSNDIKYQVHTFVIESKIKSSELLQHKHKSKREIPNINLNNCQYTDISLAIQDNQWSDFFFSI